MVTFCELVDLIFFAKLWAYVVLTSVGLSVFVLFYFISCFLFFLLFVESTKNHLMEAVRHAIKTYCLTVKNNNNKRKQKNKKNRGRVHV